MIMDANQAAACGGKEALSWSEAERRARGLRRKVGKPVVPFRCKYCGWAHVGNSTGEVGRRIRRDRLERIERRERWV